MHGAKNTKFATKYLGLHLPENIKNVSSKLSRSYYVISSLGSYNYFKYHRNYVRSKFSLTL